MKLENYLSFLSWQGQKIKVQDFKNLKKSFISSPENIKHIVSLPQTQEFLINHPLWWKKAEEDYKSCKEKGYKITFFGEEDYPDIFSKLDTPPFLTYIGESLNQKNLFPIAIVGSRESSEMTLNWMDFYLPKVIQEQNVCVVSGGARGVDQKAHKIAIRLKVPTVCFVPSGLDHLYPTSLYLLKNKVLDNGGTFISCFPSNQKMRKSSFHIRNALMACYSQLILIMQAQIRSGTMITAKKGLDYGVPIATIPGPTLSTGFSGNLQLLYDGAFLLRDGMDLNCLVENLNSFTQKN